MVLLQIDFFSYFSNYGGNTVDPKQLEINTISNVVPFIYLLEKKQTWVLPWLGRVLPIVCACVVSLSLFFTKSGLVQCDFSSYEIVSNENTMIH